MGNIQAVKVAGLQQRGLLLRPGVQVLFVEISIGVHALVLSRHAASGIGLCGLSHFDARQDQKAKLILDHQGVANTDIHHGISIHPSRNTDFKGKILIVIGSEGPRRHRGDIVMNGLH
jgi:hypothetical protein